MLNVPFGDFEHHPQIFVEDYISNSQVMFKWDIYQPLWVPWLVQRATTHQEATAIAKATAVLNSDAAFATFGQVTGRALSEGTEVVLHIFFYLNMGGGFHSHGVTPIAGWFIVVYNGKSH